MKAQDNGDYASEHPYRNDSLEVVSWNGQKLDEEQVWRLPPSKSHLIRWLLLASRSEGSTQLKFDSKAGKDAYSMLYCLKSLGVNIEENADGWTVYGESYIIPDEVLNCGNSATTLRLLAPLVASLGETVTLDSDENLNSRDHSSMLEMLKNAGVSVEEYNESRVLPLKLKGPISESIIEIDTSLSSQVLSGLILSSCTINREIQVITTGKAVSQDYLNLSIELAMQCGMPTFDGKLRPWKPIAPKVVKIPVEASLQAMTILMSICHQIEVKTPGLEIGQGLGNINLDAQISRRIDISQSIDVISPLAAIMCMGDGGEIIGAAHARHKESDRIKHTVEMLSSFGLECEATDEGLRMKGGQQPHRPQNIVNCHGDHRLFMCAAILASRFGGELDSCKSYRVSYPGFMDNLPQPCLPK